jgi:uncharacterized protein
LKKLIFFDRPITDIDNLWGKGHKEAVKKLDGIIKSKMFAAVTGSRRVGKTSVVKTCLQESKFKFILFDLSPYMDRTAVSYRVLTPTEIGFQNSKISAEAQANLAIITISLKKENMIGAGVFESNIISLLRELNSKFDHFVFVVDEAQVMAFMKGINPKGLLQLIHNNYSNVSVVLTGSMPGMLLKILRPTDSSEASFARYVERISVPKWSTEESTGFLEQGLKSASRGYKQSDVEQAVQTFSGTPGFLSYYGLMRTRDMTHTKAYEETMSFAASEWKKDIKAFLKIYDSPNYVKALKVSAMTLSGLSPTELEGELRVTKTTAYRLVENLVDAGMLVANETESKYSVVDPSLKKAIQSL